MSRSQKPNTPKGSSTDPTQLKAIAHAAVDWFSKHSRDLPWRRTRIAYRIWISECMLQQTQVTTVIPYYEKFLKRFPDVQSLAASELDEVYQLWAGLGYYRRARQLHAAALEVVASGQLPFPADRDAIAKLPGIGRYTANAIASFAYDQPCGIVEANTQRLYARLIGCTEPLTQTPTQRKLWDFAEAIVSAWPRASGELNQALMEIGSQVCSPKAPACQRCPLQRHCKAHLTGMSDVIPAAKPKKTITELREIGFLICDPQGRWLLRRRQSSERWAGLWDFPRYDCTECQGDSSSLEHAMKEFGNVYGSKPRVSSECLSVKHSVTRYRILLRCYLAELDGAGAIDKKRVAARDETIRWCQTQELDLLGLSSSARKVADWLKKREF
ncbi:MAG: A/G-specific adenine glycosylase [Planctomycetes bacterium]|nr:A/G-specific adenine glycosylase [Planctomycetota bacterium]